MKSDTVDKTAQSWLKEAQKGYIRIGVLILLSRKPSHGYEIMKETNDKSKGFFKPTAGGVYPILRDLETTGYIKGEWHRQKNRNLKTYRITEKGKAILRNAIVKQTEIANNMNILFQEFARDVLNVESSTPMPVMPNPFAPFLETENRRSKSVEELEGQRQQLKEHISMMHEKLKSINEELIKTKRANEQKS